MNCQDYQNQLDDFLDGDLVADERDALTSHLQSCAQCRAVFERAEGLARALAAYPVDVPSADFAERVLTRAKAPVRHRPPRLVAAGFVAAFAASVLTLIYTGLMVGAPGSDPLEGLPSVSLSVEESRTINLVFASTMDIEDVTLLVDLPRGIELAGYEGLRQVRWKTMLTAGKNVLPLELKALAGMGGELTARLQHGASEKVFKVNVSVIG